MKKLSGKTALITGAGRGIGRATAILFAEQGADVILVARTIDQLEKTAEKCRTFNVKAAIKATDLADQKQIESMIDDIKQTYPQIDILINNAGHFDGGLMEDYDIESFRHMLDINLLAPFYLAQKIIPLMDHETGGTIVNVSSFSGCFNVPKFPSFGAYNISKYGIWGLTEILALELNDRNIRVNQVSPSGVDTEMFHKAVPPGVSADLQPEQVAEKILYFASNESSPRTGENFMMSGNS